MDDDSRTEIEDRLELLEVEGAYARAFDSRDGETWAALFTEDGVYRARGTRPGDPGRYDGRDALAEFCSNAPFDGIHLLHVPQFTIDGDTATARIHMQVLGTFRADRSPIDVLGFYDVRYSRVDRGWRIAHRVTTTVRVGDDPVGPYPPGDAFDT